MHQGKNILLCSKYSRLCEIYHCVQNTASCVKYNTVCKIQPFVWNIPLCAKYSLLCEIYHCAQNTAICVKYTTVRKRCISCVLSLQVVKMDQLTKISSSSWHECASDRGHLYSDIKKQQLESDYLNPCFRNLLDNWLKTKQERIKSLQKW